MAHDAGRHDAEQNISIVRCHPADPSAVRLVEHFWLELGSIYGDTGPNQFRPEQLESPGSAFVLALLGGEAVGCGAIRSLSPGIAEVKRLFVEPAARRRGVASQILAALEQIAQQLGYTRLRLDTGKRQAAAVRLYERLGFRQIPPFGKYADDPLSLCFEKWLASGPVDGTFP